MSEQNTLTIPIGRIDPSKLQEVIASNPITNNNPPHFKAPKTFRSTVTTDSPFKALKSKFAVKHVLACPYSMGVIYCMAHNRSITERCDTRGTKGATDKFFINKLINVIDPKLDVFTTNPDQHGMPTIMYVNIRDISIYRSTNTLLKKEGISIVGRLYDINSPDLPKVKDIGDNYLTFLFATTFHDLVALSKITKTLIFDDDHKETVLESIINDVEKSFDNISIDE